MMKSMKLLPHGPTGNFHDLMKLVTGSMCPSPESDLRWLMVPRSVWHVLDEMEKKKPGRCFPGF